MPEFGICMTASVSRFEEEFTTHDLQGTLHDCMYPHGGEDEYAAW